MMRSKSVQKVSVSNNLIASAKELKDMPMLKLKQLGKQILGYTEPPIKGWRQLPAAMK